MKLISMTDFVLNETNRPTTLSESFQKCVTYANFLKQPLKLEMFVPCDEDGNILEDITGQGMIPFYVEKAHRFLTAKEKVLFEGFEIYGNGDLYNQFVTFDSDRLEIMNVENLITDFQYSFNLTPNAIKRIFG
jgi:hypothetical protein